MIHSKQLMSASTDYRARIYANYVNARATPLAPPTLAALEPRLRSILRPLVRRHFPSNRDAAILDLGCGHGGLLYALQQAGYRNARGVDSSPEQVAAAQRLGIDGVSQGEALPTLHATAEASLDVVVTFDVIEHLTKLELIPFVDAVHRALRPGGRWIIHVPNGESPFGGKMRYGGLTHELAFTRTSLTQLLMASGFSEVDCFEDRPEPHGLKSLVRAGLWRLIRASWLFYIAIETGNTDRRAIFSQNLLAVGTRGD